MSQHKCLSCAYFNITGDLSCSHQKSHYCTSSQKKPMYLKKKTAEEKLSPSLKKLIAEEKLSPSLTSLTSLKKLIKEGRE